MNRRLNNAAAWKIKTLIELLLLSALCASAAAGSQTITLGSTQSQTPTASAGTQNTQTGSKKAPDATATTTSGPVTTDPHQAQIIADSQKLLKLSQELKAEVAKSNKDTLSLTVIKKAEEVERLARTLKEEMNKTH